jgi:hypothetical protein
VFNDVIRAQARKTFSIVREQALLHQMGVGGVSVLDVGERDDVVGIERQHAVGTDLMDVGHHGGEGAELRLLQFDGSRSARELRRRRTALDG